MVSILSIWRAAAIAALFALVPLCAASADTLQTLHSFCAAQHCIDGANPNDLLRDASGNLYGTAQNGGKNENGIVFKLIPSADGTKYTEHILHNFCVKQNCTDGAYPTGNLIMDVEGNLYGTTHFGGSSQSGVVYKMTPGAQGWSYKVLHTFCDGNCADGSEPEGGLSYRGQASGALWDGTSPIFGATEYGGTGANLGNGVIYEMTTHPLMLYQVIRKFSSGIGPNPVLVDADGNIFGSTRSGGEYGGGLLYKLAADTWHETTLHNFCNTANCADGQLPEGRPVMDGTGNLFGATALGGTGAHCINGGRTCGAVFERTAAGAYRVLYNFCTLPDCTDGKEPFTGVVMGASGNLFGTTFGGGVNDGGVVFELTPDGAGTVLYSFCTGGTPCVDGANAATPLVMDANGALFGTTNNGGANGDHGTVFKLTP